MLNSFLISSEDSDSSSEMLVCTYMSARYYNAENHHQHFKTVDINNIYHMSITGYQKCPWWMVWNTALSDISVVISNVEIFPMLSKLIFTITSVPSSTSSRENGPSNMELWSIYCWYCLLRLLHVKDDKYIFSLYCWTGCDKFNTSDNKN